MREGIWFVTYRLRARQHLNAASARLWCEGALIRSGEGFGCIHPWPELGDPPLAKCLDDLAGERRWPLVRRALRCVALDGVARREEVSLFDDLEVPVSHATLPSPDAEAVARAREAGFDRVKLKAGRDFAAEARFFREMAAEHPGLRWRFDCNEVPEPAEAAEFLLGLEPALRERIDFVEDPCPYSEAVWRELHERTGVRLAVDREAAPRCAAAQVMVIKPAVDEPVLLLEAAAARGQEVVVTSAMDHPLGQAFAAWEAGRLDLQFPGRTGVCGLQTHHLFEPDAFTEALGPWSPRFRAPEGTGLGFDELLEKLPWRRLQGWEPV